MLGIENPIIQDEIRLVGFAEMAEAVSKDGGLEIITGLAQNTPASFRQCDRSLQGHDR